MLQRIFLSLAVLAILAFAGSSTAEARGCRGGFYGGGGGYYGGGYRVPVYRSTYYHGGPGYYRGGYPVYRSSYRSYPAYYGGGYRSGYRGGVSLSFGF